MDHGGQFEREGRVSSQVQMGGVDLCDNLPSPEALTVQTQNLNETAKLTQTPSPAPLQNEDRGGQGLYQKASPGNNGEDRGEEADKEGYREEDEEEDTDEVMKEEEEEEEEEEVSEGSSSLVRCQSPDTPMTDSSYSETGSLLETPYPFSPGTSPEPTSPVVPLVSPQTPCPISQVAPSPSDVRGETSGSNTGSTALGQTFATEPVESTALTTTSVAMSPSPRGLTCLTEVIDNVSKNITSTTERFTSPAESVLDSGLKCSREFFTSDAGRIASAAERLTAAACATGINTSIARAPLTAATGLFTFTTGSTTTGAESTSSTGPRTSNGTPSTATPSAACVSVSACTAGPVPSPDLLVSLEQLAQRGDDAHLPQHLHQIAEAFVLNGDYQRALWCIHLEQLYHQRVLDNLNALQEQWESQCRMTSSNLATQHLETLKQVCQTHSRPKANDAVCASLDTLRPTFEEDVERPPCASACQVGGGMEQRAEDSSHSQSSHPVTPSDLADGLNSPDTLEKDRKDPDRGLEEWDGFCGSQLTVRQGRDKKGGEAEGGIGCTISVERHEQHPSTTGGMEQSKPAEQQGGDLGLAQEREANREVKDRDVKEASEVLEMDDEEEDEEEEKLKEGDIALSRNTLPVEALVSGAEVEEQQLEALTEENLHGDTRVSTSQESSKSPPHPEAHLPHEAYMKHQEQGEEEVEEEDEYEEEQTDIIREAATLDDMAKLITVEEVSPASGLVSILKKRSVCLDSLSVSTSSEPRPVKTPAKRRVRFRVPDDGYEQDVGGGDSCLLLFLLCLVTVVISLGGTALYCALGDAHSSVCQDFSRNADFYFGQLRRGISHIQHWLTPGS